jgi:hypothetical protein
MKASLRTQQNLLDMNVPPREAILGEWFRQGDLSFARAGWARRGSPLHISRPVSQGGPVAVGLMKASCLAVDR